MSNVIDIKSFLVENTPETKEIKLERFEAPFVLESISEKENDNLKKASTSKRISKSGNRVSDLNTDQYIDNLLARSVIVPDLQNSQLQEFFKTPGDAAGTLKAMLRAGEFIQLQKAVMELNGFDEDDEEIKDEVKN